MLVYYIFLRFFVGFFPCVIYGVIFEVESLANHIASSAEIWSQLWVFSQVIDNVAISYSCTCFTTSFCLRLRAAGLFVLHSIKPKFFYEWAYKIVWRANEWRGDSGWCEKNWTILHLNMQHCLSNRFLYYLFRLLLQTTFQKSFPCVYLHQLVDFGTAGKLEGEPLESHQNSNLLVKVVLQHLDANELETASLHRLLRFYNSHHEKSLIAV